MERSDRIGLGIATAGHVLLIAGLSLGLLHKNVVPPPATPAIDVTLADAVALESRTTTPATPQQAQAPEEGVTEPDAAPPPPAPEPAPQPTPAPREVAKPEPQPVPKPKPVPAPPRQAEPKPKPKPPEPRKPTPVAKPSPAKPEPAKATPAKPAPAKTPPAKSAPATAAPAKTAPAKPSPAKGSPGSTATPSKAAPPRASRLGNDFLKGLNDAPAARPSANPGSAAPMGAVATRALNAEINRQIKPFWRPPSGADADQLVTLLSVHLDRNGAVVGEIEVVDQLGVTASNRAQAALHAERAIQAVRRASPFQNLPAQYFDQWKWLKPLRFDARLAQ
jgi:outer membrane biosynthesis protein TonB